MLKMDWFGLNSISIKLQYPTTYTEILPMVIQINFLDKSTFTFSVEPKAVLLIAF